LDELAAEYDSQSIHAGEITVSQFAAYKDITKRKAETLLNKLTKDGRYSKRKIVHDGNVTWAYRKSE
jgi:hypothetical protein